LYDTPPVAAAQTSDKRSLFRRRWKHNTLPPKFDFGVVQQQWEQCESEEQEKFAEPLSGIPNPQIDSAETTSLPPTPSPPTTTKSELPESPTTLPLTATNAEQHDIELQIATSPAHSAARIRRIRRLRHSTLPSNFDISEAQEHLRRLEEDLHSSSSIETIVAKEKSKARGKEISEDNEQVAEEIDTMYIKTINELRDKLKDARLVVLNRTHMVAFEELIQLSNTVINTVITEAMGLHDTTENQNASVICLAIDLLLENCSLALLNNEFVMEINRPTLEKLANFTLRDDSALSMTLTERIFSWFGRRLRLLLLALLVVFCSFPYFIFVLYSSVKRKRKRGIRDIK